MVSFELIGWIFRFISICILSVFCGATKTTTNFLGFRRRKNRMDKFNQGINRPGGGPITYTVQHTGCCKGCTSGCGANNANANPNAGKTTNLTRRN